MAEVSDDMLMAYADGALDRSMADAVERAVAGEPALLARLETIDRIRRLTRAAFADALDEAVPPDLLALVAGDPPAPTQRRLTLRGAVVAILCLAAAAVAGGVAASCFLDGPNAWVDGRG